MAVNGSVVNDINPLHSHHAHNMDENELSVGLIIAHSGFEYFIAGDLGVLVEQKLSEADLVADVDVYHAGHHGSNTSSSLDFLTDLSPEVIIISNGNHGGYQHPRLEIIERFLALPGPPAVFQTNKFLQGSKGGNVTDDCIADLEPDGFEGNIVLRVDALAGEYSVQLPDQPARQFRYRDRSPQGMVIYSLLPNPPGRDEDLEQVTLRNLGDVPISLAGWTLRDESRRTWVLTGSGLVNAGSDISILRRGMAMSLGNSGDTVYLIDPAGTVVDSLTYGGVAEGEVVTRH